MSHINAFLRKCGEMKSYSKNYSIMAVLYSWVILPQRPSLHGENTLENMLIKQVVEYDFPFGVDKDVCV